MISELESFPTVFRIIETKKEIDFGTPLLANGTLPFVFIMWSYHITLYLFSVHTLLTIERWCCNLK